MRPCSLQCTSGPSDPVWLAGELTADLRGILEDRPRTLPLRIGGLPRCPVRFGPHSRCGIDQFLGGEPEAWIGHARNCRAARLTTSKRGMAALYQAPHRGGRGLAAKGVQDGLGDLSIAAP